MKKVTILCLRRLMVGGGNSYRALILLSSLPRKIQATQTYLEIHDGISYVSIYHGLSPLAHRVSVPGPDRYQAGIGLQVTADRVSLDLLRQAFPECGSWHKLPSLWTSTNLPSASESFEIPYSPLTAESAAAVDG